jgi:hypothetical protein
MTAFWIGSEEIAMSQCPIIKCEDCIAEVARTQLRGLDSSSKLFVLLSRVILQPQSNAPGCRVNLALSRACDCDISATAQRHGPL